MLEFGGAKGSNTGDAFHELWAVRQALRMLDPESKLVGITLEGLRATDEAGVDKSRWLGVDCGLYYRDDDGERLDAQQLKYSGADSRRSWTIARVCAGKTEGNTGAGSVIRRLADVYRGWVIDKKQAPASLSVSLVSNQPIAAELQRAISLARKGVPAAYSKRLAVDAAPLHKLVKASGLTPAHFEHFAARLELVGGTASRFLLEDQILQAVIAWTEADSFEVAERLRRFARDRMLPESDRELITASRVLAQFSALERDALFPCPAEVRRVDRAVPRAVVTTVVDDLVAGQQRVCLHGSGGVGKTTALQQLSQGLPAGSITILFDCYGGGSYLDPERLRHRANDAFLQLINETAATLRLPLLTPPGQFRDPVRSFHRRLKAAAETFAAARPGALLVIVVDAADNSVSAAAGRVPPEVSFVHDFAAIGEIPDNVRFVITARTARVASLKLPSTFLPRHLDVFTLEETDANVKRTFSPAREWIEDFHSLSKGIPRVQAYAFGSALGGPETAIDALRPAGKNLDAIFRAQFEFALKKGGGSDTDVRTLCAALIALPRPVPVDALHQVTGIAKDTLVDIVQDLAPGLRHEAGFVVFADEDFEQFVREAGAPALSEIRSRAADWMLSAANDDPYAGLHVANALFAAGERAQLLAFVEAQPEPPASLFPDPVRRSEAHVRRLQVATKACREAGEPARAMRFVLQGAEAARRDASVRTMLADNPELSARFGRDTAGRLVLGERHLFEVPTIDIIVRAAALEAVSTATALDVKTIFPIEVPKPREEADVARRRGRRSDDEKLHAFVSPLLGFYKARAAALMSPPGYPDLAEHLQEARKGFNSTWRYEAEHQTSRVWGRLALAVCVFAGLGYAPSAILALAIELRGGWIRDDDGVLQLVVRRLSAHGSLHDALLKGLTTTANALRDARVGAEARMEDLVSYARLLAAFSPHDAEAIFQSAVDVAGELDAEVYDQCRFIDALAKRAADYAPPVARDLAEVAYDAGIRLADHRSWAWGPALRALARLDLAFALACVSRWDDAKVAPRDDTLDAVVAIGLDAAQVSLPAALGLILLQGHVGDATLFALKQAAGEDWPKIADALSHHELRGAVSLNTNAFVELAPERPGEPTALLLNREAMRASLEPPPRSEPSPPDPRYGPPKPPPPPPAPFDLADVVDPQRLAMAINARLVTSRETGQHLDFAELARLARETVPMARRIEFLDALRGLPVDPLVDQRMDAITATLDAWSESPAVAAWSDRNAAALLRQHFGHVTRYVGFDRSRISALDLFKGSDAELLNLLLEGIEVHGEDKGAAWTLGIATLAAGRMAPEDAGGLLGWYVSRLRDRLPEAARERSTTEALTPSQAVARTLYAAMSDVDQRVRWRAAHALRQVAALGGTDELNGVMDLYGRQEDLAFRRPDAPFYPLAAQLWLLMAIDRTAVDLPAKIAPFFPRLLEIASDEVEPHVVIRAFARDAAQKLLDAGVIEGDANAQDVLSAVNQSRLPTGARRSYGGDIRRAKEQRYKFDSLDMLPSLYGPTLRGFSTLTDEKLLETAERWIMDVWHAQTTPDGWAEEPRTNVFKDSDYGLTSTRGGSLPVLEHYRTYLEWHALWCAVAEEIGANDDRNTLGKWLAHHLAELIQAAETDPAAADRAVDTILRIWAQRDVLPAHAYPAERFDAALHFLGRLAPGANPWRPRPPKLDADVLGDVVDGLSRLVLTAIVLQIEFNGRRPHQDIDLALMDPDERELIETFSDILAVLREQPRHRPMPRIIFKRFLVDGDGAETKPEDAADDEEEVELAAIGAAEEVLGGSAPLSDEVLMRLGLQTVAEIRRNLDAYEAWLLKRMEKAKRDVAGSDAESDETDD